MSDDLDAIRAQFGVDVDAPLHTYRGAMGRLFAALDAVTAERDEARQLLAAMGNAVLAKLPSEPTDTLRSSDNSR